MLKHIECVMCIQQTLKDTAQRRNTVYSDSVALLPLLLLLLLLLATAAAAVYKYQRM
jgi:hypothetical protein